MKKLCITAALAMASVAPIAQADMIFGLYAGAEVWQAETSGSFSQNSDLQTFAFEDETLTNFYVALEHPIPLIPNIKIKHNELEVTGSTTLTSGFEFGDTVFQVGTKANTVSDLTHNDLILYYEIFDNDLVAIDLGLNAKQFDGSIVVSGQEQSLGVVSETVDFSGYVPMAYAAAEVGLPFTGLSVFAEGSLLSVGDSKVQDYQVGVAWEFIDSMAIDVAVKVGYRSLVLELDDLDDIYTDFEVKGPFAGLQVHF